MRVTPKYFDRKELACYDLLDEFDEKLSCLEDALREFAPNEIRLVRLRFGFNRKRFAARKLVPFKEISRVMGEPVNTLSKRCCRILRKLRSAYKDERIRQ